MLLSIEAMKMVTARHAEHDGAIADVMVRVGDQIDAKDLLILSPDDVAAGSLARLAMISTSAQAMDALGVGISFECRGRNRGKVSWIRLSVRATRHATEKVRRVRYGNRSGMP